MAIVTLIRGNGATAYDGLATKTNLTATAIAASSAPPPIDIGTRSFGPAAYVLRGTAGASATLKVDPTNTACASIDTKYRVGFWLKAESTGAALPAAVAANVTNTGTSKLMQWNIAIPTAGQPIACYKQTSSMGFTSDDLDYSNQNLNGAIPLDTWVYVVLAIDRSTTVGAFEVHLNGQLVLCSRGGDTDTGITWSAQTIVFTLPAWTGIIWNVAGPIISADDPADVALLPLWPTFAARESDQEHSWAALTYQTSDGSATNGTGWSYSIKSGSPTLTAPTRGVSGVTPYRHYHSAAGSGTEAVTYTTNQAVGGGTLTGIIAGVCTIGLADLYVPSGARAALVLYAADNTTARLRLSIEGGWILQNGKRVMAWDHAIRYAVMIHLTNGGVCSITLDDLVTTPVSTTTVFSAVLPDGFTAAPYSYRGDVATCGKFAIEFSSLQSTASEHGYLAVGSRLWVSMLDSMQHAPYTTPNPDMSTFDHYGRQWPFGSEQNMIPGGGYPQRENGMRRRLLLFPSGRSGLERDDYTNNCLPGFAHTRGVGFMVADGGFINDITGIGVGDSTAIVNAIEADIAAMFESLAGRGNQVLMMTSLNRNLTLTITGATNAASIVLTSASHGLTVGQTYRVYIAGVGGNTAANGLHASMAVTDANTLTLTGVAGNGTYTSGGTIMGFTPQELAAVETVNERIRSLCAYYQRDGWIRFVDVAQDQADYPATYPATVTFWKDFVHTTTAGENTVMDRITALEAASPSRRGSPGTNPVSAGL